jgi:hypothetical protein
MIALPPDVARDITGRLDRMCLILAWAVISSPRAHFAGSQPAQAGPLPGPGPGIVPGAPRPALEQAERDLTESVLRALRALLHSLDTADADDAARPWKP